jgi:methyltransferase (TIGR00027 family)
MTEKGASWTARWTAMARGIHLVLDDDPKIFEDTLGRALADFPDDDPSGINAPSWADRENVGVRTHVIWRSRIAEDRLQTSVRQGMKQYVLLGAGLDSFAYRRPVSLEHVAVFEIDHPASQAWKRQKLEELGIPIPENVHFVPVDFETDNLLEKLKQSAFDPRLPVFFCWLGVVPYLSRKATRETLQFMLAAAEGYCELAFDFVVPPETVSGTDKEQLENTLQGLEDAGEPTPGLYRPNELEAMLKAAGFDAVTHISSTDGQKQYFDNRSDKLRLFPAAHMMAASRGKL